MKSTTHDGTVFEQYGPQAKEAVVLIHGLGLNREVWQWLVPALSDNYNVITYDLFGHGDSARPPCTPSLKMFSDQLRELLDYCEISAAAVVGFSLGGMIARRFAQDEPERVSALGILHSPHQRTKEAQAAILKRVDQARTDGPAATVEAALERWFTDDFRQTNPETMNLVRSWVLANNPAVYHTIYRVLADGIDEITLPKPPIACPTIVMTGDEDFGNGPEMAQAIAAEIEGAETYILKGLRHMAIAEDPATTNLPLKGFLDRAIVKGEAL